VANKITQNEQRVFIKTIMTAKVNPRNFIEGSRFHHAHIAIKLATTPNLQSPDFTFPQCSQHSCFSSVFAQMTSNNTDERAGTDRAWKVRPVVEKLQQTFGAGYNVPPVLAFDEAVIPSRSRHNVTRQYLNDKPHKWGTKLFMTCCADTAYCLRYVCMRVCGLSSLYVAFERKAPRPMMGSAGLFVCQVKHVVYTS